MHTARKLSRTLLGAIAIAGALLVAASPSLADKVTLKDGKVVTGTVLRETDSFVQIRVSGGGIETTRTILKSEVKSIEKDAAGSSSSAPEASKPEVKPDAKADPKPESKAPAPVATPAAPVSTPSGDGGKSANTRAEKIAARAKDIDSGASRVAILNFGAPLAWHNEIGDEVGIQVNANAWKEAVKLLEKDRVNVVVVRINSGGGLGLEVPKFQNLFENVYKKKFRTVGWVESAISAAAMSPYVLEEFYFLPDGNLGACTMWSGNLRNAEGVSLEKILITMEEASRMGRRSPAIMKSMQVQTPLSATIDATTGEVTWFQDTTGQYQLNPPTQIFTFTANDAVKFKFARGIAANKEELAKAMGLNEVVWAGEEATRFIDDNMRATDRTEKQWKVKYGEFALYAGLAEQSSDMADRQKFVGKALAALKDLRRMFATNPNFGLLNDISSGWFDEQEEALKKLLRKDR